MTDASTLPRIALDAMGGDHAPGVIVEGALAALAEFPREFTVSLVGDRSAIESELTRLGARDVAGLSILHAEESVAMAEKAAASARTKTHSSIAVALKAVKDGDADGMISAGNTGAVASTALLTLGRIAGLRRAAIAAFIPTDTGGCILLDCGATSDCKPEHLLQFAVMGSIYCRLLLGRAQPRVGLLNIGEEPGKGNEVAIATYQLLAASSLPFAGNIEGRDVLTGAADVIVTDGFTGNILLKFAESIIGWLTGLVRESMTSTSGAQMCGSAEAFAPVLANLRQRIDYAEYGGAPLLGVDGVCFIAHGSSSARAVKNAVRSTARLIRDGLATRIRDELAAMEGGRQ